MTTAPTVVGHDASTAASFTSTIPAGCTDVVVFVAVLNAPTPSVTMNGVTGISVAVANTGANLGRGVSAFRWAAPSAGTQVTIVTSGVPGGSATAGLYAMVVYLGGAQAFAYTTDQGNGGSSTIPIGMDPEYQIALIGLGTSSTVSPMATTTPGVQPLIYASRSVYGNWFTGEVALLDQAASTSAWTFTSGTYGHIVLIVSGPPKLSGVWGWVG